MPAVGQEVSRLVLPECWLEVSGPHAQNLNHLQAAWPGKGATFEAPCATATPAANRGNTCFNIDSYSFPSDYTLEERIRTAE